MFMTSEVLTMRNIPFAAVAIALSCAAWPHRPTLPGDQFQLAVGDGTAAPTQHAVGKVIMGHVAKGEGWM
jgi:hypothetical protein